MIDMAEDLDLDYVEVTAWGESAEGTENEYREKLRGLVESGGCPYIKITLVEPEAGGVEITMYGLDEGVSLADVFEQLAGLIREQEAERG